MPTISSSSDTVAAAARGDERAFGVLVEPYRAELRAYCYRMAGSIDDADDLLQESLLRAWRGLPGFDGRASVRTWLHRVTSSACIDRIKNRTARKRAEDRGPPAGADDGRTDPEPDAFLGPCPASIYDGVSPEARYGARESVSFAFLAALQLLPPKQRATLIACDVLGFSAEECAAILESSASSIESALRRARESIAERTPTWTPRAPDEPEARALVARWIAAWDDADADALVALLHEDATMSMPPLPMWMQGPEAIRSSIAAMVFAGRTKGSFRAIVTEANGLPALAIERREGDGAFAPYALHVLAIAPGGVRTFTAFLDVSVLRHFARGDGC